MGFKFREKKEMELPYICLEISGGRLTQNKKRFKFYKEPNLGEGWALCHRYSFDSMSKYLCWCYNRGGLDYVQTLIDLMYDPNDNDYSDALRIYSNLERSDTAELCCLHLNELLYVLNNARINLRAGKRSWNCSIGSAYDPESWELIENDSQILIKSNYDIRLLNGLLDVRIEPPTIFFYTARDKENDNKPFLYSSNNTFDYERIEKYGLCNIPVFIPSPNGILRPVT